mgnify:FL=1
MSRRNLTVLTWNVWFGPLSFKDRCESILKFASESLPDVICFQEATRRFVINHLSKSSLLEMYDMSDPGDGSSVGNYGVLTLCKKDLKATFTSTEFMDSAMDRSLLATEFNLNGERIVVGTVHLESLNNHPNRMKQLEVCNTKLSPFTHAILCGDFNFCSYRNFNQDPSKPLENDCLAEICPEYVDMWLHLHVNPYIRQLSDSERGRNTDAIVANMPPHIVGYTFDSEVNKNIDHFERFRIDRVVYKTPSSGAVLRPESIEIVGKTPINQEELDQNAAAAAAAPPASVFCTPPRARSDSMNVPVFPSDHFGLLATFAPV